MFLIDTRLDASFDPRNYDPATLNKDCPRCGIPVFDEQPVCDNCGLDLNKEYTD